MTKVLADDFDNDQASSLVEFLTAMSNGQIVQHGKSIEVTGLSSRRVKFLVNKFLHVNRLSEYGVLDTAGNFEIVHIRPETKQAEEAQEREALKPTMARTITHKEIPNQEKVILQGSPLGPRLFV